MRYKLAIFDMDGTILDTLEDLAGSLNAALEMSGYPKRTIDEVRRFVGNGIRKLVERGVPQGTELPAIDKVFEDFKAHYKLHCTDTTKPYEGILHMLEHLKESGCKIAVVSNKADFAVQELCEQYFPGLFDEAVGERQGIQKKPAPDSVNAILARLGIERKEAVYVGDSEVDIATAKNAKMDSIIVEWGFREAAYLREQGASCIVSQVEEVEAIILGE